MTASGAGPRRLDLELVRRELARSRSQAQDLISRGLVTVGGKPAKKASQLVGLETDIAATGGGWVSRAAEKLAGALDAAGVEVPERVLDAGASTGGFTQVVLGRGAGTVYAVDVGHGQLAPELAADSRVRNLEGINLRDLTLAHVGGEPVGLAVADVSFISLALVLEPVLAVTDGAAILLVKPQFEVGRELLPKDGVVKDPALRARAVDSVAALAAGLGWRETWRGPSPLPGQDGNVEHFLALRRGTR